MDLIDFLNLWLSPFTSVQVDEGFFLGILKLVFLLTFILYLLFALIVVRQVHMMTRTFKTSAETVLKLLAYLHFVFSFGIVLLAYFWL